MKINYRPEIDGLRAIAVAAVILYHAQITIFGFSFFKGGFIGVDIFFVISGYLITSIILKELETTGNFSFTNFYERRARRILPALLVVMLISIPFAWIYLLPGSLVEFSKSIVYSLGFSSNFYFHYSGLQYGAENGLFIPFLHTWSLSVEEQFYILFPIILFLTFRYLRKYLLHALVAGFVISLGLADWGSRNYPSFNFYTLPARGWELSAGSLLAYLELKNGGRLSNKLSNQGFPILGLLLIGYSIIFFDDKMSHPSLYTLPPIFGACLLIWFSNTSEFVTKTLSSKIFVGTGLISYSLYLWHYPIFAFYRYSFAAGNVTVKLLLPLLLIFLSITTYFIIEKPFRNKIKLPVFKVVSFIGLNLVALTIVSLIFIYNEGFSHRANFGKITIDRDYYLNENKDWLVDNDVKGFRRDISTKVLITGDSHADDLFKIFKTNNKLFKKFDLYLVNLPIKCLNNYFSKKLECDQQKIDPLSYKAIDQSDIIVFSNYWGKEDFEVLEEIVGKFQKNGKKVVLTMQNPIFHLWGSRYTLIDYFIITNRRTPTEEELGELEKKYFNFFINNKIYLSNNEKLNAISIRKGVKLLDKSLYQCDYEKKTCVVLTKDGYKVNWDSTHHTVEGAKFLGEKIYHTGWFNLN